MASAPASIRARRAMNPSGRRTSRSVCCTRRVPRRARRSPTAGQSAVPTHGLASRDRRAERPAGPHELPLGSERGRLVRGLPRAAERGRDDLLPAVRLSAVPAVRVGTAGRARPPAHPRLRAAPATADPSGLLARPDGARDLPRAAADVEQPRLGLLPDAPDLLPRLDARRPAGRLEPRRRDLLLRRAASARPPDGAAVHGPHAQSEDPLRADPPDGALPRLDPVPGAGARERVGDPGVEPLLHAARELRLVR